MNLFTYIQDMRRRASLAADTGFSPDYLWQVATGRRRASTDLALLIEAKSSPRVDRSSVRPDLWTSPVTDIGNPTPGADECRPSPSREEAA